MQVQYRRDAAESKTCTLEFETTNAMRSDVRREEGNGVRSPPPALDRPVVLVRFLKIVF